MIAVSSQDLRNEYVKFYNEVRRYLWPFQVLKDLAEIETNIYSAFMDVDKLRVDFAKLRKAMKDVLKDDKPLSTEVEKMQNLLDSDNPGSYFRLPRVNEVNPENDKRLKIDDEKEEGDLL